jgi:N-methylhydantoinase B
MAPRRKSGDTTPDSVTLEIFKHLYASVAEEMGHCLQRAAYSPNIKERRDHSCAVFDSAGLMVAQAAHLPVHLGSMPLSVKAAIDAVEMSPGDVVALNDPYHGGTHLPDITFVSPVHLGGPRADFYVASRAHHADVGGAFAGSMGVATDVYQEGLRIPPVVLARRDGFVKDMVALLLANVRTPQERRGDLAAQLACVRLGERRLGELGERYGPLELRTRAKALQDYAEKLMRRVISELPDGEYSARDFLDNDGVSERPVCIKVKLTVDGDEARLDFAGSDPQCEGNVNAVFAVTLSAVFYVFRCIAPYDIPSNWGCLAPVEVIAPEGSVVNPVPPAPVAAGNVETSQRIVDVLFAALAKAGVRGIPASSCGSMSNVTIGGVDPSGRGFTYYETVAGGAGASEVGPGVDAVHTHMTNTLNTPVEAIEAAYPLRVRRYEIRKGTGGGGRHRGGDGVRRDIELLCDAQVSLLTERRVFAPRGSRGGAPGAKGINELKRRNRTKKLPSKTTFQGQKGDVLSIRTPGGGGYGRKRRGRS